MSRDLFSNPIGSIEGGAFAGLEQLVDLFAQRKFFSVFPTCHVSSMQVHVQRLSLYANSSRCLHATAEASELVRGLHFTPIALTNSQ
jgi:hypothetical protein